LSQRLLGKVDRDRAQGACFKVDADELPGAAIQLQDFRRPSAAALGRFPFAEEALRD
jgi:hypothetical protein